VSSPQRDRRWDLQHHRVVQIPIPVDITTNEAGILLWKVAGKEGPRFRIELLQRQQVISGELSQEVADIALGPNLRHRERTREKQKSENKQQAD
jgi:hypothetical protein